MKKIITSTIMAVSALLGSVANAQTWTTVPTTISGTTNNIGAIKIACGSASHIAVVSSPGTGVTNTNNTFKLNTANNTWESLNIGLTEIAMTSNGTAYGLSPRSGSSAIDPVYRSSSDLGWTEMDSQTGSTMRKITANNNIAYGINSNGFNTVSGFVRNNNIQFGGQMFPWQTAPGSGTAEEISIGDDGTIIATNASAASFRYVDAAWVSFPGVMHKVIVRNSTQMLGWTVSGDVFVYNNSAWGTTPIRTNVRDISVASDGTIYAVLTDFTIVRTTWNSVVTSVKSPKVANIKFNIYPNPSAGVVNIELPERSKEAMSYSVTNTLGQEVSAGIISETKTTLNLSKGFYFVKIQSREGISIRKITVE